MPKVTLTFTFDLPDQYFPKDEDARILDVIAYHDDPAAFIDAPDVAFTAKFEGHDRIYTNDDVEQALAEDDEDEDDDE